MSSAPVPRILPLLAVAAGCNATSGTLVDTPYALAYDGSGCVTAAGEAAGLDQGFTIEAWVQLKAHPAAFDATVASADDVGELWVDETSVGLSSPNHEGEDGWFGATSVYDGRRHHVAATFDDAGGAVFVDGTPVGTGETPWQGPRGASSFHLGCGAGGGRSLDGTLDEIRVSSVVRYDGPFAIEPRPFDVDDDTVALWHLDDGDGLLARDATDGFPATVDGPTWTGGLVTSGE